MQTDQTILKVNKESPCRQETGRGFIFMMMSAFVLASTSNDFDRLIYKNARRCAPKKA
jgi:hypothetical protein